MNWNGEAIFSRMHAIYSGRVERAAQMLTARMKAKTQTPYPPASAPGQAPHLRSGDLNVSIGYQMLDSGAIIQALIGSPLPHGKFTDEGTSRMAARPWCAATLLENSQEVRAIIAEGADSPAGV